MENWERFDEMVMTEHVRTNVCKPPYIANDIYKPKCQNQDTLIKGTYDVDIVNDKYLPRPCQEMSKINFGYTERFWWKKDPIRFNNSLAVILGFPDKVKVISQTRGIDPNTLLGIIGGYIGLFLGKHIIK